MTKLIDRTWVTVLVIFTLLVVVVLAPTSRAQDSNKGAIPALYANMTATAVVISKFPTNVSTVSCTNTDTNNAFVQFFNLAAPTVGTSTPLASIMVPAGGGNNAVVSTPWTFDTALSIAGTTTVNGSSAPTASTLHCTIAIRASY